MKTNFYFRLAKENIKKNRKIYYPYILSCILSIMLIYMMDSLSINEGLNQIIGGHDMAIFIGYGRNIMCIFVVIFLFYTNSFLLRRRKKEFGLYGILGMEKKHVSLVIFFEYFIVFLISLLFGIGLSLALDKLVFLVLLKMLDANIPLGFYLSIKSILFVGLFMMGLFLLLYLNALRQIRLANPIELLQASKLGEKEPRAKFLLTIVGLILLGAGYFIALMVKQPLEAMLYFFIAVILVILATYILFTAGTVTLLKLLKKNKNYYYKPNHFISISNMIYRMKQNAIGLANIAILYSMVLVALSTTISLWVGYKDIMETRYPKDIVIRFDFADGVEKYKDIIFPILEEKKDQVKDYQEFAYTTTMAKFDPDSSKAILLKNEEVLGQNPHLLHLFLLEDYNQFTGEDLSLDQGQIYIYGNREEYGKKEIKFAEEVFTIKDFENHTKLPDMDANTIYSSFTILARDQEDVDRILTTFVHEEEAKNDLQRYVMMFDLDIEKEEKAEIGKQISKSILDYKEKNHITHGDYIVVDNREIASEELKGFYGGFLFIGCFLSIIFVIATGVIMYYKQVSEGMEDRQRFDIMQKVGLDKKLIRDSINRQVLLIFFLPLAVSCIHLTFAFPMLTKLLNILMLSDNHLFVLCTLACVLQPVSCIL